MENDKSCILDHQDLPDQTDPVHERVWDNRDINGVSVRTPGSCPKPSTAKNYTTSSSSYLSTSSSSRQPSPPSIESSNTDSLTEQGKIEIGYTVYPSTVSLQDPNLDRSLSAPLPQHVPSYDVAVGQSVPDGPDGTVYKVTTEPVDKENSCCLTCYCRGCCKRLAGQGMTKRKIMIILVLGIVGFTSSFALCLFPPFFPRLAESKGANAAVYGPIIGTNCLVSFIASPIIGQRLHVIGVRFAFIAGVFGSGGCCVLAGFLEYFPSGVEFVVAAVAIRIVHAIANTGIITATFAFYAIEFPESRAKIFACYRSSMNIAQLLGPVLGGAFLEVGGFKLPFFIMGTLQMLMCLLSLRLLPCFQSQCNEMKAARVSILSILSIPGIWVAFVTYMLSTMSNGFLSITLEPHILRQFHMTPFYVGLLFGLKDGANSLAAPFWGWLCDRNCHIKGFIIIATVFAFTSFVLLGPTPGIEIEQTLTLVAVALILNGIGICGQQLVGMDDSMREALDSGMPNSESTHGCVTGLCSSLAGAGRFISRAASGILVTQIGFRNTSVIVLGLHLIVALFTLSYITVTSIMGSLGSLSHSPMKCRPSKKECDPKAVVITSHVKPSDLAYMKTVTLHIPIMREDLEGSMIQGSAPTYYERHRRSSWNVHSTSLPQGIYK